MTIRGLQSKRGVARARRRRKRRRGGSRLLLSALCVTLPLAAGCGDSGLSVQGHITANGAPIDLGTISFRNDAVQGVSAGAGIDAGKFTLGDKNRLPAGSYQASVMAFKKTGKIIDDPLRGPQPETVMLSVTDTPQKIEINAANAGALELEFHTEGKP